MDLRFRLVTQLPAAALWTADGSPVAANRGRLLGRDDIAELLRGGEVRFVVADCGHALSWIPIETRFEYWKREIKPRLVEPEQAEAGYRLDAFPEERCYLATLWEPAGESPIVLLESSH